jgi:hypothetical protein
MLRHIDRALAHAAADGHLAIQARLEAEKGYVWRDEALLVGAVARLVGAVARAEASGDTLAQSFAALRYGNYLAQYDQLEKALGPIARAIDIMGAQGERLQQALMMASQGRCFFARAGKRNWSGAASPGRYSL